MTKIYIVRHGRAASSWSEDIDPGLDDLGRSQAVETAAKLAEIGRLDIVSSPLKRAHETALPYAKLTNGNILKESRVSEIPTPDHDLENRGDWLAGVMRGHWSEQAPTLRDWQQALIAFLIGLTRDTAVFSHFVAINVAVGAARGDDRVIGFRPDNGSITCLETDGAILTLLQRGSEASTHVG